LDYKAKFSPKAVITLVSNGSGEHVNKVLATIPEGIVIENSSKAVKGYKHYHIDFNNAPLDHPWNKYVDYSNGCQVPYHFGIGLGRHGYYCCAIAGAIDRVLGFNEGKKELPDPENMLADHRKRFCQYCGHFYGNNAFKKVKMTKFWREAYAKYRVNKPKLTTY
jgi:hypothetical protein